MAEAPGVPGTAPVRALLFDLDGTLADTAAANGAAYARALGEVGVHVDGSTLAGAIAGRSWRQFLPPLLAEAGVSADPAVVARRKAALYADSLGAVRLNRPLLALAAAAREGALPCRTAVVTTASRANAGALLAHFDLLPLFDLVITGDDVARHKPDPEAYRLAAARLGVPAAACLAFEDSEIGARSAEAAGIRVVRVALAEAGGGGDGGGAAG